MTWIIVFAILSAGFACAFALCEWVVRRQRTTLPDTDDAQDWLP